MTVDEAIRKYQQTISALPYQIAAVDALVGLFKGIRAHEDYTALYDAFTVAIPAESREQHVNAMERLVLDLAGCEEANP